ncbi:hypothetical protein MYX06_03070 [Patescibacteria group bacterium AH-259-L05]|nr:hypothetical protein [Patescibacteria group bacterium AH-259-L05]
MDIVTSILVVLGIVGAIVLLMSFTMSEKPIKNATIRFARIIEKLSGD